MIYFRYLSLLLLLGVSVTSIKSQSPGSLDLSFGVAGTSVITFSSLSGLNGMAVQPDGKMLTVGWAAIPGVRNGVNPANLQYFFAEY